MNATGLSIRRLATYQQYSAPLVIVSETAQQTALPLLESMVRESIARNMHVLAVCLDTLPSTDITGSPLVQVVDRRLSPESILSAVGPERLPSAAGNQASISLLQRDIETHISRIKTLPTAEQGVLVVIDSLDRLLRVSQAATLGLLRGIRRAVGNSIKTRLLTRFGRDFDGPDRSASKYGNVEGRNSVSYPANALSELADAMIDVYPLDTLKKWMPGWYSDGKAEPFISLGDNDFWRGLARLEHKRQSGKVGFEVSTFEISTKTGLPKFSPIDVSAAAQQALSEHVPEALASLPEPKPASATATATATVAAAAARSQETRDSPAMSADPTANLSFNLSLTDKQRRDKANVELPYLEAQVISDAGTGTGAGGSEIHYQLDDEDDWDNEDPDDDLEI
ncbi:hypothetical protein LPJ53_000420 [Coemansia erecta]|uniref:Elongator complex protein 5 n=1 Tax=Coemansia erecta TaxID=147472 RepID=A0A9W8CVZ1_9FUNG|nr:hypothetical protein LPJ53_000420 [Coemansia erecta]